MLRVRNTQNETITKITLQSGLAQLFDMKDTIRVVFPANLLVNVQTHYTTTNKQCVNANNKMPNIIN